MRLRLCAPLIVILAWTTLSFGKSAGPARFSPQELARGYRNQIILAKPKAEQRAAAEALERQSGITLRQRFDRLGGLRVLEISGGADLDRAMARLRASGSYEFVEPDYVSRPDATEPNDPTFPSQWALSNTGQLTGYMRGADIHATAAWDTIHDAPNVIVAIVDTGVRIDHKDIAPNLWTNPNPTFGDVHGASFLDGVRSGDVSDETGHGTHVAGIICAAGNNGVAMSGVAWKTQLMVLKHAAADGYASSSDSAACIDYAVSHGASVINCSWGGSFYSRTEYTAFKAARDAGIIVVCSAGNDGQDNDVNSHYPSNYLLDNIVSVGNSTPADAPNDSSDYGNLVDLFAPGTSIYSLDYQTTDGVIAETGTSMSAPLVSGSLVLLRALHPTDSYRDSINRLLNGTDLLVTLSGRAVTNGRLNLSAALNASKAPFNAAPQNAAIVTGSTITLRANNRWGWTTPPPPAAGDPVHAAGNVTSTLWWQWYAPAAGSYIVDTSGSEYDTALDVYTGSRPSNIAGNPPASDVLHPLVSNDDDGANKTSRVIIDAPRAGFYFICTSSPRGTYGYTQVNISLLPPNDDFAHALAVTDAKANEYFDNRVATLETGEPAILNQSGTASVWYKWTAPRNGRYQASVFSYDFDALLAVYTGDTLDGLTLVTADDDTDAGQGRTNSDSRCTFEAVAGTTYYFQAETVAATARGAGIFSITDSAWQASNDGGMFLTAPSVAGDGTLYLNASIPENRFYAFTPDGTLKWTYLTSSDSMVGAAAIGTDGAIFQGLTDGTVLALNPDGTLRWQQPLGTSRTADDSIGVAADGTVYAHGDDGYLYALNPADGATKWKFDAGMVSPNGGPVIGADGTIYQASDARNCLYAIKPDGTSKWRLDTHTAVIGSPAIDAAGNLYVCSFDDSNLVSMSADGVRRWSYEANTASDGLWTSPALSADGATVYIASADGYLHAVNTKDGLPRWTFKCGGVIYGSSPAIDANGVIYVAAYDGLLYAVNPDGSLKRTWAAALGTNSSPTIVGTRLYLGSADSKLYAFDIGATAASGPWPQFRHDARHSGRAAGDALAITTAPTAQTVKTGAALSLSVIANGTGPLTYQWSKDGAAIAGATAATYTVSAASAGDAGSYTVTVSGPQGTIASAPVTVTVETDSGPPATPGGRLINLSIRSQAGTGSQTLIVGATVNGGTAGTKKPLLIRGVGPTLASYGVGGTITEPVITLYSGKTALASNDGWLSDAQIAAVGHQVGAFPLKLGSADAALYTPVDSGAYTVQLTGKAGTGVALVEVYDATPGDQFTTDSPRLTNASARTQVGTGDNVLIVGFTIDGTGSERLLLRGVGAKLGAYGVSGVLANPKLELYAGKAKIDENDNWTNSADVLAAFRSVSAFPLDAGSKDAVLMKTLDPGTYSAVVRGVGDTTGVALIELYELQ